MPNWTEAPKETLHRPRLLCLHGGGTNATVFRLQCRSLIQSFIPYFRLVFADAPYHSPPHPAIIQVYGELKPFRRWLAWTSTHEMPEEDETVIEDLEKSLRDAMRADDETGADGEWVGLLGFSQGGKMIASMLFEQQLATAAAHQQHGSGNESARFAGERWRFGICMAGRGPLVALGPEGLKRDFLDKPSQEIQIEWDGGYLPERLNIPTVHVHGLLDPGLKFHRLLYTNYCKEGTTKLVEWEGDHRLPFKTSDVQKVVDATLAVAESAGVLPQEAVA